MKRQTFLLAAAIAQLLFGLMYFFLTEKAINQFIPNTCNSPLLIAKAVGVFLIAFGLVNFHTRKSPDTIALKAIMIATLFYLITAASYDAYWTIRDSQTAQAWGLVCIRVIFIIGHIYYTGKMQIKTTS